MDVAQHPGVSVMRVITITSGKGGVGKSTVSLNLALALAEQGHRVGLLDADLYGPDIPLMIGLTRQERLRSWDLWRPSRPVRLEPVERFGIRVMSAGFLLGEDQALALAAPLVHAVLHQLLTSVAWGELDELLVDLPPGTADLQQQLLRLARPAGALIVVGPQDLAHLDARKVLDLLGEAKVPVLGGVENFTELACPHCGQPVEVFPRVASRRSIWAAGVACLGRIPMDAAVASAGDSGRPLLLAHPTSRSAQALREIAGHLTAALDADPGG
jgi:ATP-binding protein involved in chromosome partitioning